MKSKFSIKQGWFSERTGLVRKRSLTIACLLLISLILPGCSKKIEGITSDQAADVVMTTLKAKVGSPGDGNENGILDLNRSRSEDGIERIWFTGGTSKTNILRGPKVKLTFVPIKKGQSTKVIIRATSGLFLPGRDREAEKKWGKILAEAGASSTAALKKFKEVSG